MKLSTTLLLSALAFATATRAEPAGLIMWTGKGSASVRGGDFFKPTHLSAMHFANGRTVFSTVGPGPLYGFGGLPPATRGRTYYLHVDQVYVGKEAYPADGTCEVKLRADRTLKSVGCAADGGPEPSMHFDADRTPPDIKSFDPPRPIVGQSGKRGG